MILFVIGEYWRTTSLDDNRISSLRNNPRIHWQLVLRIYKKYYTVITFKRYEEGI